MTLDDIVKVVSELNDEIIDMDVREDYQFTVYTNGFEVLVHFNGIFNPVWSSEEDMRDYDEETGEYESLRDYLLCELKSDNNARKNIVSGLGSPNSVPIDVKEEILEILSKKAKQEKNNIHTYCNPNFMNAVADLLETYYNFTEEELDGIRGMIRDMYEC